MDDGLPDGYELRTTDLADDDRARAWFQAEARGFHEPFREREMRTWRSVLLSDRTLEIVHAGRIVATSTVLPRALSMPYAGDPVRTAAVTAVTVQPEHRRQGLMRAMMLRMLRDARAAGEPIAALYASEAAIYGRFGFGLAVEMRAVDIPTRRVTWLYPPDLRGRLQVSDAADVVSVMVAAGRVSVRSRPGLLDLRPDDLHWMHHDEDDEREGGGERQLVVLDGDRGAVAYRVHQSWSEAVPDSRVKVHGLWAVDAEAERALVAYCCAIDLVETVELRYRPVDDWIPLAVDDHVRLKIRREDPLYVRVLDVPAALGARRSAVASSVVLEVRDPLFDDTQGRWGWDVGPDTSVCRRTDRDADVTLDVRELGSLLLGGVSARQLADAGRLEARDDAALRRVAHAFGSEPAPWAPITF